MEEGAVDKIIAATHWPRLMAATALGMLALFLLVLTVSALKSYHYIGTGISPTNTIQVSGEGKVFAVPDTATFSVTVQDTAADVQTAQTKATNDGNTITDYLKSQGIADTDIQTTDYEITPQYSYSQSVCPQPVVYSTDSGAASSGIYCPPGKQTLTGYQVSETLTVKVKDTTKAGALLSGVGSKGASSVSGLSFTVSDEDTLQAQARDKAIAQAQGKAQNLAKSLGVQLVGVVGFNENNNQGIYPVMYASGASTKDLAAPAPEIQTGQNTITDDVTLTYEIR
ncbi:MAG TPA: SIMPL domain-containing protein [Candidatus Paceibacterota bacterium]|nr:SIMPL domain-containing protein [Candidatus Paceibacterota bacterium]